MRPLLALTTLAALVFAGCGGGGGSGSGLMEGLKVAGFEFTDASGVSEGEPIATRYTCDGENVAPALVWTGVPEGTQELALVLEDPDAPGGTFTHWLVWGLDQTATELGAGVTDEGRNDLGKTGYGGPCPPGGETHRYVFRLLALDDSIDLQSGADRAAFDDAVAPHVLAEARLTATYKRS